MRNPEPMVRGDVYAAARARADGAARRARALTAVANQAAFVLPRPGQAQACWRALAGRARQTV